MAEREDGVWFFREYAYNGYGVGWSKWQQIEAPEMPTKVEGKVDGGPEFVDIPYGSAIYFGFNLLRRCEGIRVRLPRK